MTTLTLIPTCLWRKVRKRYKIFRCSEGGAETIYDDSVIILTSFSSKQRYFSVSFQNHQYYILFGKFNEDNNNMNKSRCVCETLFPWWQQSPKSYVYLQCQSQVKVTRPLILVSFERSSLASMHAKYKASMSYGLKVIAKVIFKVDNRQTNKQTDGKNKMLLIIWSGGTIYTKGYGIKRKKILIFEEFLWYSKKKTLVFSWKWYCSFKFGIHVTSKVKGLSQSRWHFFDRLYIY